MRLPGLLASRPHGEWGDGAGGNWIGVARGDEFCVALTCEILPDPGVAGVV